CTHSCSARSPTCWPLRTCWPTRCRCPGSPSPTSCCRSSWSPSSRPSATTPTSATSPARLCGSSMTCATATGTCRSPCRSARTAVMSTSNSTTSPPPLPDGFRLGDNDTRILAVAKNLQLEGKHVVLVSKDLPMRIKASASGIHAEEYRAALARDRGYTGMVTAGVDEQRMSDLYDGELIDIPEVAHHPVHTGVTVTSPRGSALGRITRDKQVRLVPGDQSVFGVSGRSAEQRIAIDLLLDESIGIVSLGGRAGTGKSALALCTGLEAVLERRAQRKIMVFRPLCAVGGQELGYLPGDQGEKMGPWG